MTLTRLAVSACVSVAMAGLPAAAALRTAQECPVSKPTAASYTWSFQREADSVFRDVQYHALRARYDAEELKSITFDPDVSWQRHADELSQLKYEIDSMGDSLCRLGTIRRAVAPWQQSSIDRIVTAVRLMADNAQDAITFLNTHQQELWMPAYQTYVDNLYSQARSLTTSVGDAVEYAKLGAHEQQLKQAIGVKTSS